LSSSGTTRASRCASRRWRRAGQARDFTDVATELAARTGLTGKYVAAINKGACGVPLKHEHGDHSCRPTRRPTREQVWDAVCRAASAELSEGSEVHGLDWWRETGLMTRPFSQLEWYLTPTVQRAGLRFELPYQERLKRVGVELGRRLHEHDMHWWDTQLQGVPGAAAVEGLPRPVGRRVARAGGDATAYPFWLLTARSMQYAWGGNVGVQMIKEVADNIAGHRGVIMNPKAAARLGIQDGDEVEIATPKRRVQRPRRAAPGHPPRHPAADRPVRPLGHAAGQGLRRAEHERAGADGHGPDRRHRLGRRHRAREDRARQREDRA
jgi:phenylacetyl-CoA:acceptor oxidoreductase